VRVWTKKPDFHHTPVGGFNPLPHEDPRATYRDQGWGSNRVNHGQPFKPLTKQDKDLEQNAWNLVAWSACAKGVQLEDWQTWAHTMPLNDDGTEQDPTWGYDNWSNLMFHRTRDSDLTSNVHYKRFLMEVNLKTAECKIIVPRVHWYDPENKSLGGTYHSAETQEISHDFATRLNYAIAEDDDIPF
jgi:hypothetical protein